MYSEPTRSATALKRFFDERIIIITVTFAEFEEIDDCPSDTQQNTRVDEIIEIKYRSASVSFSYGDTLKNSDFGMI